MTSATATKVQSFTLDMGSGTHNFSSSATGALYIFLTNTAPSTLDFTLAVDTMKLVSSSATGLSTGNGYTALGGILITGSSWAQSGAIAKAIGAKVTWTGSTTVSSTGMGPFRYSVLYNNSGGSTTARPVIQYWDYGASVTLANTETFTVGNSNDGTDWTSTYPLFTSS